MGKTNKWLGPISGVLFVVAIVASVAITGEVDSEPVDSASSVLADFRESADDIRTGAYLSMLGVGFLLIFLGHLRTKFRQGGAGWAADGFLAGGVIVATGLIVFTAVQLAGAEAGDNGHAEVAQGAIDFLWNGTLIFSPGLLAVGIAAAVVSFTHRTLPIWVGVLAIVVALGALAPWLGIAVFVAWVLAASIAEIIQASRPPNAADAT